MSRFHTPVDTRWLREWEAGRQLRMTVAPVVYQSDVLEEVFGEQDSIVIVPPRFVYDGASIARKVAGFTGHQDEFAPVIHDWFYITHRLRMGALPLSTFRALVLELPGALDPVVLEQALREVGPVVPQAVADRVYLEILLLDGMPDAHAQDQYAALDFWGKWSYESGPSRFRMDEDA